MDEPSGSDLPAAELLGHLAAGELADLVKLALETIQRATGLESSYLTFIDWADATQRVTHSLNTGALDVPEGAVVPWEDTLCRRSLTTGVNVTSNADEAYGTDNAGHELGITSYVSIPVVTQDRGIYGTLCAASTQAREVSDDALALLRLFADLIARQVDRELANRIERERAAEVEHRMRTRLMMVAESEHRVKTPLTVIRGAATLLAERWDQLDDDRRRSMVASVARQSDDLFDCVEVLLAQAREEMDEVQVSHSALFVEPVMTQVATDHGLAASDHTIAVHCEGSVVARTDAVSLQQMLGHLIDNAIKYSPSGGHITLSARAEGERATITVADDGPGLPDGLDPFAAFARGEMSEQQATGSGLGLHIVRTVARRLGGDVHAVSAATGGAEFVIDLPGA